MRLSSTSNSCAVGRI
uniref:Uncharacterized protein n=1 Tax=Arundo donax TaxID=35708 RepID=A0A0A9CFA0_ARUDO